MTTTWHKVTDKPIPHDAGPLYITDGARVSYVKSAELPFTEGPRWILAEPSADNLKLEPQVSEPTHWTQDIGLPKVADKSKD